MAQVQIFWDQVIRQDVVLVEGDRDFNSRLADLFSYEVPEDLWKAFIDARADLAIAQQKIMQHLTETGQLEG